MRWLLNVSAEKRNSSTGSGVIVRRHGTSVGACSRRGAWLRSPGLHFLAEHRAPLVLQGQAVAAEDAADDRGEDERAGAAALHREVGQLGLAAQALADAKRAMEAHPLAGEHAPRQRQRRHHAGVVRAAVRPQGVGGDARQEVAGQPRRRQRVALAELRSVRPNARRSKLAGPGCSTSVATCLRPMNVLNSSRLRAVVLIDDSFRAIT